MRFQQRQVTRATQLELREHGFYVSQRDSRGQVDVAVEIPYEEVLPLRLEYRSTVPGHAFRWLAAGIIWLFGNILRARYDAGGPLPADVGLYVIGGGAGLGLLLRYAWYNWWHQATLHTARLHVALADRPGDRHQLRTFVQHAERHTKHYLRREYGPINPLGVIEPQLRRLAWLRELDVLSAAEAQALATRLTGRLPGRGLRSMGQRLEAPYVN